MTASRLLKLILILGSLGWGVSIISVFLPWPMATEGLGMLGAGPLPNDPMLDYWLRMAGGGFTMIGAFFAAVLFRPDKYANLIPLLGWLSIGEGFILLISGLRLKLPTFPFIGDTTFCFLVGIGLIIVGPRAEKESPSTPD
ncbi:hypothetical protein N9B94_01460 [Verrucomicrobia bacterium]|nr:hypothetical protein [Verrucomicrobiota bacterium]